MKYLLLLSLFMYSCFGIQSQTSMPQSILEKLNSKLTPSEVEKIVNEYNKADDTTKSVMLTIYSMPMSSKRELIDNYEKKKTEINELKSTFDNLVPKDYIVSLELKESDQIRGMVIGIDLLIYKNNDAGELDLVDGDWDIDYGSNELDSLLSIIDWDRMTLLGLKNIMQTANCISIQNGKHTEIGFARSGLGKYFYEIFSKKLSKSQIDTYNDGCEYIYYKENIALRYVGGMAGPQCFPDE